MDELLKPVIVPYDECNSTEGLVVWIQRLVDRNMALAKDIAKIKEDIKPRDPGIIAPPKAKKTKKGGTK